MRQDRQRRNLLATRQCVDGKNIRWLSVDKLMQWVHRGVSKSEMTKRSWRLALQAVAYTDRGFSQQSWINIIIEPLKKKTLRRSRGKGASALS
jgi:hypothetical protein